MVSEVCTKYCLNDIIENVFFIVYSPQYRLMIGNWQLYESKNNETVYRDSMIHYLEYYVSRPLKPTD